MFQLYFKNTSTFKFKYCENPRLTRNLVFFILPVVEQKKQQHQFVSVLLQLTHSIYSIKRMNTAITDW